MMLSAPFRRWRDADEPCELVSTITSLCRGGCKVVSAHLAGDGRAARPRVPPGRGFSSRRERRPGQDNACRF